MLKTIELTLLKSIENVEEDFCSELASRPNAGGGGGGGTTKPASVAGNDHNA